MKKLLLSAVLVSSGLMASDMPVTKEEAKQRETLNCACKGRFNEDAADKCRNACSKNGGWSGKAILTQNDITCVCMANGNGALAKVNKTTSCSRCSIFTAWEGDFLLRDHAPLRVRKGDKLLFDQGKVSDYND